MIEQIHLLLHEMGIDGSYAGFHQASYAILLCVKDTNRMRSMSKLLYPLVAKNFHISPSCVERNIRTIAAAAWCNSAETLTSLARFPLSEKPAAARFISILATYIICENR